jgi:glucokinase
MGLEKTQNAYRDRAGNKLMLIGVDVGGTNLRVGVVDKHRVVWENRYHADFSHLCKTLAPAEALAAIQQSLAQSLAEALALYPAVSAVGIGFPGFIDPITQHVLQSPNLPGLINVDVISGLRSLLNLPVIVENDASAAAYGEYAISDKLHDLIYIGLGTGVGGGLILADKSYPGSNGFAMEIGHLCVVPDGRLCGCGNHGCMEQYASASGVVLNYSEVSGAARDAEQIAALAAAGDAHALQAYRVAGDALAQGLAHILKVLDVADVVIGGGLSLSWNLLQPAFESRLNQDLIPVLRGKIRVHLSKAGDQAGIIGAAMLAQLAATA